MDKIHIYKMLEENIKELRTVENEISMVQFARYKKTVAKVKESKYGEIREFFENKSKAYNQSIEKYEFDVEKCIERCKRQMNRLITAYDNFFLKVFEMMQDAMNNQKIMIANIITLNEQLNGEQVTKEDKEKIAKLIKASAQKKLNYSVIIEECNARLTWCIENFVADAGEIFVNKSYEIQEYKENIFQKILKKISNMFSRKNEYKEFLENYKFNELKKIKQKNNEKIYDLAIVLTGVIKQIEDVERQITQRYIKTISVEG